MPEQRRILLVDDDRDLLEGTSVRLGAAGYQTLLACNGNEGIASAVANRPDAIVLDVRMPILDGLQVLAELRMREATKDIPVVMLSASLSDQRAALEAGARFFLRKPYAPSMLINAMKRAINDGAEVRRTRRTESNPLLPATYIPQCSPQPIGAHWAD